MKRNELLKRKLELLLQQAGITLNGPNAWDPQVHDARFYAKVIAQGSVGLGEAYMDGWFDIAAADQFFSRVLRARLDEQVRTVGNLFAYLQSVIINEQNRRRSREPIVKHYDLSTALYTSFLDSYNQYTCCYFPDGTETLEEAAIKKMDLICRKLQLKATDHLLDIGCGWGGLAKYAAEQYGCRVTGVSISETQLKYARTLVEGLPVELVHADYRELNGTYDKVVCVGMIEHVGYKNYSRYMHIVHKVLKDDGLFLLHTIGRTESMTVGDPWLDKYIFPNGMLPSVKQIGGATERLFVMEDWHNFGAHYYHTLMAWHENFKHNWPALRASNPEFDERFYRMWTYYLLCCAGAFHSRRQQLWQIVFSKKGVPGGYESVR
jgi:cyclopropane-fatty-acyl-phospholipid synthase